MPLYAQFDCSFPEDPKVAAAGDIAELVYFRCVLKCRELLTDGVIDRRLLPRWIAGIRGKAVDHANRLVEAGLWDIHADGWCIPLPVWIKWNPTAAQVAEKREKDTERKRSYRDKVVGPTGVPTGRTTESARDPRQPKPKPELTLAPTPKLPADPAAAQARREIWSALAARFGEPATGPEKSNRGKQVNELLKVNATAGEIAARANEHAARRMPWTLTANAMVTHWVELAPRQEPQRLVNGVVTSRFMQG